MRKITSNGGRDHHQCCLSGDLPVNQGPPNTVEIRVVRLTGDAGIVGSYDYCSLQRVTFDAQGRPVHIQNVVIVTVERYPANDEADATIMRSQLMDCLLAVNTKPIIDLTD